MLVLTSLIESIVKRLPDSTFMRATDNDANIDLDSIDLAGQTIFIFNNLPEISIVPMAGGMLTEQWPVEIDILRLAELDDNTSDGDELRDSCLQLSKRFINKWIKEETNNVPVEDFEFSFAETVKIYDKILTGGRLVFTVNLDQLSNNC